MPHSSGGGHSSSSHSSHSSHSRSHSSSGSSHSSHRSGTTIMTSTSFFNGSKKFGYYNRHGDLCYIYSNSDLTSKSNQMARKTMGILLIVFSLFFFVMFVIPPIMRTRLESSTVGKIENTPDDYTIIDDAKIIENETSLYNELSSFYETTGIPVCVKTIEYSTDVDERLDELAYSYYINNYSDEFHFVILCTQTNDSEVWGWEAVQGDLTDDILTSSIFANIQNTIDVYKNNGRDFGLAISKALSDAENNFLSSMNKPKASFSWQFLISPLIFTLPFIFTGISLIKNKKEYFSVSDDSDTKENIDIDLSKNDKDDYGVPKDML